MLLTGTTYMFALDMPSSHCTVIVIGFWLSHHNVASLPAAQWRIVNQMAYNKRGELDSCAADVVAMSS